MTRPYEEWGNDPDTTPPRRLSKQVLRAADEDTLTDVEQARRQRAAERRMRSALMEVWEDPQRTLVEHSKRLRSKEDAAWAVYVEYRLYRSATARAVQSAEQLAGRYGPNAEIGKHHFVEAGEYEHHIDGEDQPAYWRREEADLIVLDRDGDPVLHVAPDDTFAEVAEQAEEAHRDFKPYMLDALEEAEYRSLRRTMCEKMLDEVDVYGEPLTVNGTATSQDQRDPAEADARSGGFTGTPNGWEENAARMHAYIDDYEMPSSLQELEQQMEEEGGLGSFSHKTAWIRLKEQGYASGTGRMGLVEALNRWAPDFEEKYGYPKAVAAAEPFDWPRQWGE